MVKNRKMIIIVLAFILIIGIAVFVFNNNRSVVKNVKISAEEAKEIIDQDSDIIIIIDVRSEEEYQTGHIEGAVCIPNEVISDQIERLLSDKEQEILVYCRSGRRSSQAVDKLLDLGYTNVKDFGGIIDWPYKITK
ncbi:rhodanese-like domain-containing protein [Thomasclavelia cocleata]|uniref:rhodanese-like domain-containing protein n=1 Tax=Thomasclavelia cocleata TaxID=69824 RepID=UPI00248BAE22|nr:rhodanese-like domain-containing protein [Thomasclavelia cocleata]